MEYSHHNSDETNITTPSLGVPLPPTSDALRPVDNDTIEEMYREHQPWMHRAARRYAGWDDAEDVTQAAWMRVLGESGQRVLENLDGLGPEAKPFLYTIVKNLVTDHRGLAYNRYTVPLERGIPTPGAEDESIIEIHEPAPTPSAEDEALAALQQEQIHELLGKIGERLFPRERALIEGIMIDGQPYAEYAQEHGITETMAKNQVYKMRQKIRRTFGEAFNELDLE